MLGIGGAVLSVFGRTHELPPFRWIAQAFERISVDWLKGGNVSKCVRCFATGMPKSGYLSGCIKRHVEQVVHTQFAGLAARIVLSLLLQRGIPDAEETRRQI